MVRELPRLVIFVGYVYISMDNEFGPFETVTNYHPELQDEIWNGFLSMDPLKPAGPEWDAFTERVIEEFQDPVWDGYPRLAANATTSDVNVYAGNHSAKCMKQCTPCTVMPNRS